MKGFSALCAFHSGFLNWSKIIAISLFALENSDVGCMLDRAQWKCSSQGEPPNSFNTSHLTHLRLVVTQNHEENHEKPLAIIRDRTSSMSPSLYATISHYISLQTTNQSVVHSMILLKEPGTNKTKHLPKR